VQFLRTLPTVDVNKPQKEGCTPFYVACQQGHKEVVSLLMADLRIDVNKPADGGFTPFYIACQQGHKEVMSLLLADMRIDVNKPRDTGATPFLIACENGHKEVVSMLMADKRIDVNTPENDQCTPLWIASQNGDLPIVQLILASGREVNTKTKSIAGAAPWSNKTAAEVARYQGTRAKPDNGESEEEYTRGKQNGPLIATLIDSYEQNPQQVRTQLRKQLGLKGSRLSSLAI